MTNKEAIEILKNNDCYECTFGGYGNNCKLIGCEVHQAIDKAIKALNVNENRACFSCKHNNKQFSEMPCKVCDDTLDKWEAEDDD